MKANVVVQPTSDLGLDDNVPSSVVAITFPDESKWLFKNEGGTHGLLVFKNAESAMDYFLEFKNRCEQDGNQVPTGCSVELTFDEAREVAKSRPLPVCCLILDWQEGINRYHYVR